MPNNLDPLRETRELFYKNYDNPDYAKNYAEQLQASLNEEVITVDEAREEYEIIQEKFPRLYHIRNFFAEALAPWIFADIDEITEALSAVEDYYHRNPDNESLAESYALSLWLLYEHPKAQNRSAILETLSELINAFPDNDTISEKYYQVLDHQDDIVIAKTSSVAKRSVVVKTSASKPVQNESDAQKYAASLLAYAKRQNDLEELQKTFSKFESLCDQFPESEAIKEHYASALYSAFSVYDEKILSSILEKMCELQSSSSSEKIAEKYALLLEDCPNLNWGIIQEIKQLYSQFPNNESIIDSYAFLLSSFFKETSNLKEQKKDARELFDNLCAAHPEHESLKDYTL